MNDLQYAPSSRGVPHMEASANTRSVNTSISRAPGGPIRSEEIQVPRSPQTLSLQLDGLNARIHDNSAPFPSYVESSERDSDTSTEPRRPELQPASPFTDPLSRIPSSSMNDSSPSIKVENSQSSTENAQTPTTHSSSQEQLSVNGNGSGLKEERYLPIKHSNGSLSPLRSLENRSSRSGSGVSSAPKHKRTATGDVKSISSSLAAPHSEESDKLGATRCRSKSTGSSAHGSRIAQLSVHIRTRLSYAAAKVEKSRQAREKDTQLALRGLESLSEASTSIPGGVTPTQALTPTSHPQHSSTSINTPRNFQSHHRSQSAISSNPGKLAPFPKLAPPVDIIPSNGDTRRRRPNPNSITKEFNRSPYARHHRRHHSVQEPSITKTLGSPPVLGPGPTHIPPSARLPLSAQHEVYRSRTHSQSTAMEQDAIETLLFMSSPENSQYRSSPRPLLPPTSQLSLNESIHSQTNGVASDQSQSSRSENSLNGRSLELRPSAFALETNAGDEIDRILDQMESDSEDDERYASHRARAPVHAYNGHMRHHR
ncbi:hypothetical protein N7478_002966 [Penicillium angulare]|uniref:uncharacterized protein n=1 Tax=Penicillium angulare TaxID=116970 RepID=UPI002541D31F|nr:uncharacterized protein N7478_002966 [Penicillium angulare]KAJ5287280.1 hypothetical protein N7478_002966 [Penicillium angulare]